MESNVYHSIMLFIQKQLDILHYKIGDYQKKQNESMGDDTSKPYEDFLFIRKGIKTMRLAKLVVKMIKVPLQEGRQS